MQFDYDAELQQYREQPRLNVSRLRFERWLIDHGRSEHAPASCPRGELTVVVLRSTTMQSVAADARS